MFEYCLFVFFFYCLLGNQCVTRVAERAVMQLTQKKYKAVNVPGHKNTAAKDILGGGAIQY